LTQFSGTANSTASPASSPPTTASAAYQNAAFFTSPHLSPLMSPQPNTAPNANSMMSMSMHTPNFSSSNSPTLQPLSPMHNAASPSFFSPSPLRMSNVPLPSLSLTPSYEANNGKVVEVGPTKADEVASLSAQQQSA